MTFHPDLLIFVSLTCLSVITGYYYRQLRTIGRQSLGLLFAGSIVISVTSLIDYLEHTVVFDWVMAPFATHESWTLIFGLVGYVPAILLMAAGAFRWFHMTIRLEQEIDLRRDAEESLQQRTKQLSLALMQAEEANTAKTRFLANMSHELRTPLNAIIGFSEMMNLKVFGQLKPEYEEYATLIHTSGKLLLDIINDILDLSKVEAGHFDLDEKEMLFSDCVDECLPIVEPGLKSAGLTIELDIASDLALVVDQRITKQMVLNLLSNAIKFTEPGGVVTIKTVTLSDGACAISVKDTGIGMTQEEVVIARQPFGQVEGVLARSFGGTGLGLALVGTFIELHGGKLEIESEKGRGTEVQLIFPAERVSRERLKQPA